MSFVISHFMSFFTINLLYALVLMCGSMIFGGIVSYGTSILNVISVEFDLSTFEKLLFQSIPLLISIFGPFLFNFLLFRIKRKIVTSITGCFGCAFMLALLSMNKKYFWIAIIIRGFQGLILSGVSVICPLYILEISPDDSKGIFALLHPISIIFSYVVFNLMSAFHKWQYPIFLSATFILIFGSCVWLIPDSPSDPKNKNLDSHEHISSDKKESIFDSKYRRDFTISMILMFSAQFSGISMITQNCSSILYEAGIDFDSGYQMGLVIFVQFISCCTSSFLIDKLSGKLVWMISSIGTTLSLLLYVLNIKFNWVIWIPIVFLFIYQLSFGFGMANIPFYVILTAFPPGIKQTAITIGMSLYWISTTLSMIFFPYFQSWLGQFYFMLFLFSINALCALFGIIFIKEKKVSISIIEDNTGGQDSIQDNLMDNQGNIANL